jgi:sulfatase maturation enzyme AslB (radical SAM superfamily)
VIAPSRARVALASLRALEAVLTSACNLRCAYCYQRSHPARRMSWDTLRASVRLLDASRQPEIQLGFYGGEPLLEQGLLRRGIEHARQLLSSPGRRLRLSLTTNGTLLDPDLAGFLATHRVHVRLSFDGIPEAQAARGAWTHPHLDAVLESLRRVGPVLFEHRLSVGITLTGANLTSLADSVEYLLRRRVRTIGISPRLTPDPDWSPEREGELDRQLARVRSVSLAYYARSGRVPVALLRRTSGARRRRTALGSCSAGVGEALTVDVDGQVTACAMFAASYGALPATPLGARLAGLALGRVTDPDLGRRLEEHQARARATGLFAAHRTRNERCRRCEIRTECLICPASVAHILDNDDPRAVPPLPCAFNRLAARHRALFPVQPSVADILEGKASPLPVL